MIELQHYTILPNFIQHKNKEPMLDATQELLSFYNSMIEELVYNVGSLDEANGIALPEIGVNVRVLVVKIGIGVFRWCNPSYIIHDDANIWRTKEKCVGSKDIYSSLKPDHVTFRYELSSHIGTPITFESNHQKDNQYDESCRNIAFLLMHLIDHTNGIFGDGIRYKKITS